MPYYFISESQDLTLNCPSGMLKKFTAQKRANLWAISTSRSDVIDYFKCHFKDGSVVVKDENNVLRSANYEVWTSLVFPLQNYFRIPSNVWSSKWCSRFIRYSKRATLKSKQLIQSWYSKVPLLSSKELEKRLLDEEWILPNSVPGCYVYRKKYMDLIKRFKILYRKHVADSDVLECMFAPMIPIQELLNPSYLHTVMENLFYTVTVKDCKSLQIRSFLEQNIDRQELLSKSTGVHYVQNYCSCQGLYGSLKNKSFESPCTFIDDTVTTYRNEHGKCTSLQRLESFNRIELVKILPKGDPVEEITLYKEKLVQFLKVLGLNGQIEKTGSWILEDGSGDQDHYTLDFNAYYEGKRLQICNLSYNGDFWTHPNNIKIKNKETISLCSGLGLQRLVWLFLMFNGTDESKWSRQFIQSTKS